MSTSTDTLCPYTALFRSSISLANKLRGEGNETRFGIVFNRVQTKSEVSQMLMERIGQALPANVVPHTIPHREHMREAAILELPVWRLAKATRRNAPVLRAVVSYNVEQAEREADRKSALYGKRVTARVCIGA